MDITKNYVVQMNQAKKDVQGCLRIWSELLKQHFSNEIEFAYAKGSATKSWDSVIDYVPMLSDVDIHIKLKEGMDFFSDENSIHESILLPEEYEQRFKKQNPSWLHIPRVQIMNITQLQNVVDFVYPRVNDIMPLIGKPGPFEIRAPDNIRQIDLQRLQELQKFLPTVPLSMMDRTGMELWTMIRRINWMISPSPIRLLSQTHADPLELWGFNRTAIVKELNTNGFHQLAEKYIQYYSTGWTAFHEKFLQSTTLRRLILQGFNVLQMCLKEAKRYF